MDKIQKLILKKINYVDIDEIVSKKIEEMLNEIAKNVMGNRITYYLEKKGLTPENVYFLDFIEMARFLKLPIFEVRVYNNPFDKPNTNITHKCYETIEDYATEDSIVKDSIVYNKKIPDIFKGAFTIYSGGGSWTRYYTFIVTDFAVLVHEKYDEWD